MYLRNTGMAASVAAGGWRRRDLLPRRLVLPDARRREPLDKRRPSLQPTRRRDDHPRRPCLPVEARQTSPPLGCRRRAAREDRDGAVQGRARSPAGSPRRPQELDLYGRRANWLPRRNRGARHRLQRPAQPSACAHESSGPAPTRPNAGRSGPSSASVTFSTRAAACPSTRRIPVSFQNLFHI